MKKNVIILMLFLLGVSWYMTITGIVGKANEHAKSVAEAQRHENKEMYIAALNDYKVILGLEKESKETLQAMAKDYYSVKKYTSFVSTCKKIIENYDADQSTFDSLMTYYEEGEQFSDEIKYLHILMKKFPDKEYITERYNQIKGTVHSKNNSYAWVSDFYGGFAACRSGDEKYSSVNSADETKAAFKYEWAGPYSSVIEGTPVLLDTGVAAYVDGDGNKLLVPDTPTKYLGIANGNYILAQNLSGKYGYIKEDCTDASEFIYDDATAIENGFGAVMKDGKWALIDDKINPITDFIYDDVVMDENHVATSEGVIWVQVSGEYQLINRKGEVLSVDCYEGAKPFVSKEPCAAKKNGKWGFVSISGEEVTEFIYEDAKSFCSGFAPVYEGQFWKYIDNDGRVCIDNYYTDAKPFAQNGVAFVQVENSYWVMVELVDKQ